MSLASCEIRPRQRFPLADDDAAFAVEVRDDMVYLDPRPIESDPRAHWMKKLEEGLQQNLPLVLAKSVIGLDDPRASRRHPQDGSTIRHHEPRCWLERRSHDPDDDGEHPAPT
jgi:hypothetical protein